MDTQVTKRKKRSDRMHAIYLVTCVTTGERYVGLTVCAGNTPKQAVEGRWKRHITRALTQAKDWTLCQAIRAFGAEAFKVEVLEKVRGKAQAHQREREVTKQLGATLNTA
jgi:GIY-YIG catalytic domain